MHYVLIQYTHILVKTHLMQGDNIIQKLELSLIKINLANVNLRRKVIIATKSG